ncbi:MAG: M14 family metallopeptidase [Gemmatimonadota bacterium]|nr:M14 family metallopeptidase [Gemmatimonadota bacterium]
MTPNLPRTSTTPWPVAIAAALMLTTSCSTMAIPRGAMVTRAHDLPVTRAERTNYLETSHYADVIAFLDSLKRLNAPLAFGSIGRTSEGRDIPYVIASRPLVHSAAEARATGKLIVYVQGNIHAGEVEGKEALQALLRDLTFAPNANVLDSIVLVAVPIYNADGNERFLPQERQRGSQNGPEMVGQRPNAQGLDLNRDYIKAEAPETRASLAMFNEWNPDVFVDLHTTDGSFHGYALTYSPSLNPSAPLGDYSRTLLTELRQRVRTRDGFAIFDYGNFNDGDGREISTDSTHSGWYTYDSHPRFGTNYYGLRGRISILSEAFSHDPFERRVKATYSFVTQLLSLVAERSGEIRTMEERANAALAATVRPSLALAADLPMTAPSAPVSYEILERTGDSTRTQPGVPKGLRRTGRFITQMMPVFDRFVPTLARSMPEAYYLSDTTAVAMLRMHGVRVDRVQPNWLLPRMQRFAIDSVVRSPRPFQGHNEVRPFGHWEAVPGSALVSFVVPTNQPLGRVAMYLLDPESDDGLATWNMFDAALAQRTYPVLRAAAP